MTKKQHSGAKLACKAALATTFATGSNITNIEPLHCSQNLLSGRFLSPTDLAVSSSASELDPIGPFAE